MIILFGATGDLSRRKLIPGLAHLALSALAPDIQVVGEDLVPLGKVKDFSPYVAKIRAAGADTIITGSFGQDFTLLARAARDSKLDAQWYTYYGGAYGSAAVMGEPGIGKYKVVVEWNPNWANPKMDAFYSAYKAKWPQPHEATAFGLLTAKPAAWIEST